MDRISKTENIFKHIYIVLLIAMIGLIIFIGSTFKTKKYTSEYDSNISHIDDWYYLLENSDGSYSNVNFSKSDKINIPADTTLIMRTTLSDILPYDTCMSFTTNHLNLLIYSNGKPIYEFAAGDNAFGNSSGYGYHLIDQLTRYKGTTIEFHISSPYGIKRIPDVKLGSSKDLLFSLIHTTVVPFVLAVITLIIGFFILIYGIYTIIRVNVNRSFIFLGLFTITLAFYSANEQPFTLLLLNNNIASSYISFILLMFMPIPFILFLKELYTNKHHIVWNILILINLLNAVTLTLLQVTNTADFKNTLIITHIVYALTIITTLVMTCYELVKYKITYSMKLNLICVGIVAVCLIIAVNLYYISGAQIPTPLGDVGFLIYIVVIGLHSIKLNTALLEKGRKAERYKSLAYTDKLTGIGNRTAHDDFISHCDFDKHNYIVVMFDLNNLKYYNDTYGHDVGDVYITTGSSFITKAFNAVAGNKCYRIGGDEFCVIITDRTVEEFNNAYAVFKNLITEYNKTADKLKISIACGYAEYDSEIDLDLKETRSRADAMMYENKFLMKQERQASPYAL